MAYSTDYTNARDAAMQARIAMGMVKAAISIAAESIGSRPGKYDKRQRLATGVLNRPDDWTPLFAYAACTGAAITPASTDTDIDNRMGAIWDAIAGVTAGD